MAPPHNLPMLAKKFSALAWLGADTRSVSVLIVPSSRIVILILSALMVFLSWLVLVVYSSGLESFADFVLKGGRLFQRPSVFLGL